MLNVWNNMDAEVQSAIVMAVGGIITAIITGIFTLIKRKAKRNNKSNDEKRETIEIPMSTATMKEQEYNSEDYVHNHFIPSLDELEKENLDDAFAEKLATFIGVDRSAEDISIIRKGE